VTRAAAALRSSRWRWGGLWHGAAWTFVASGVLHRVFVNLNHVWREMRLRSSALERSSTRPGFALVRWGLAFLAVNLSWRLFRAPSFSAAWSVSGAMLWRKAEDFVDLQTISGRGAFDFGYPANDQGTAGQLPTAVLFGDSFTDVWFSVGLHQYFRSIYRTQGSPSHVRQMLASLPAGTRYLIWEYLESSIDLHLKLAVPTDFSCHDSPVNR
jgi:hypothetical protein